MLACNRRKSLLGLASFAVIGRVRPLWAEEKVVHVYSSRHYGTDDILWQGFTAKSGVRVRVVEGEHDALLQRLIAEGANSPADLLITVDAGRLAFAAERDLLQPVRTPTLEANVPAHLRHPQGLWWGLAMRARVIVYNKERVDPSQLRDYEDLAEPRWRGRVLVRSSTNIYNISLVGAVLAHKGVEATEAWVCGLVANLARPPQGGDTDQIKAVAAGVGDVAIVNSYYFARLAASEKAEERAIVESLGVIFPNQDNRGTHVNISGGAVTRHAPHREHAIALLEYLSSPEAQRYFADVSFEYPVNPQVEPHPALKSLGSFKQDTLNAARYAELAAAAVRIMDRCGWR